MKTIKLHEFSDNPEHHKTVARTLENGGLVCVPCRGTYRILADFDDERAVTSLMQSKRRTKKAPSLVFIRSVDQLKNITHGVDPIAEKLAKSLWPGPLTILFEPSDDTPKKILKQVAKANGHIGVRIPDDEIVQGILEAFGGPVLVSSANREKRGGETSPAQIRKNFVGTVDIFIDAGDLAGAPSSTVVEVVNGELKFTREGEISVEQVEAVL